MDMNDGIAINVYKGVSIIMFIFVWWIFSSTKSFCRKFIAGKLSKLHGRAPLDFSPMSATWPRRLKRRHYGDCVITSAWSRFNSHPGCTCCCVLG